MWGQGEEELDLLGSVILVEDLGDEQKVCTSLSLSSFPFPGCQRLLESGEGFLGLLILPGAQRWQRQCPGCCRVQHHHSHFSLPLISGQEEFWSPLTADG